ncbi:MAG: SIS domain-containing protein [Propionibacteriaceae bacterium]|jgi:fructoselysine-6-phosphate deglycase|nr:SIS domain-containing protein [Propionibacteriaceae bacterium]
MLNIDLNHHLETQTAAVAAADQIRAAVVRELDSGIENIFFASAGGVALLTYPAARLLQTRSSFPTFMERSTELIAGGNANLGPKSLVVFCSVSGTTQEAVAALRYAKGKGARVMTFTGTAGTPMAVEADINFCNPVADDTSSECYLTQTLLLALAVLEHRGEWAEASDIAAELRHLPAGLVAAKQAFEPRAAELAAKLAAATKPILISSGGNAWYEAWYFGMCILEEMQWIWTRPIHALDFFHGTLELVEPGVDMLLLKGEDAGRELAERVARFVPSVGGTLHVVDAADFDLPGLSPATRALIAPAVLATVLERLAEHIAALRDHPLTVRRYYKRLEY